MLKLSMVSPPLSYGYTAVEKTHPAWRLVGNAIEDYARLYVTAKQCAAINMSHKTSAGDHLNDFIPVVAIDCAQSR